MKKYEAKFSLDFNGQDNQINPQILNDANILVNDKNMFKLQVKEEDDCLFELIVQPPNTVIYNYYDPSGELYMSNSYSDDGIVIE